MNKKIEYEKQLIEKMIHIYCKGNHKCRNELCEDCKALLGYSKMRLDRCPFKEAKQSCGKCKIHCYKSEMQKKIKKVMKYSGMRIIFTNPKDVIVHIFDFLCR